jgi:putative transposase
MTQTDILTELAQNSSFDFSEYQKEAIKQVKSGKPWTGKSGVLTPLIKKIIEASLAAEMDVHMDECATGLVKNRRNGKTTKTLQTGSGPVELDTPRDRAGTFEPELVKKRQTILTESLDDKILGLYGLGMSYQDIRSHMEEMYGVEVSQGLLSKITDKLLPIITEWRSRPLEALYTVVFLDAMFFKAREDGKVVTKAIYNILGVN